MTNHLTLLITAIAVTGLAWYLVRTISGDRPVRPPNALRDWREELLEWRRLGIH
jgi:hypothetical protein